MRKWIYVLIAVLLFGFLTGCASAEERKQERLEKSMAKAYAEANGYDTEEISVDYLGAYQDCHVAYFHGPFGITQAVVEQQIGKITFVYPDGQKLHVYRDGEVLELSEAYEAGWVSDEILAQIRADFRIHQAP